MTLFVSYTLCGCRCYLFLYFYTSLSLTVSLGVGVKGTTFPGGTVKSLTRGSNQTQTSKWWVSSSSLLIRPEAVSGGWFVPSSSPHSGLGFSAENPHAWAGRAGIMRHYGTTKASAPALSHSGSMYGKIPVLIYSVLNCFFFISDVADWQMIHKGQSKKKVDDFFSDRTDEVAV